MVIVVMVMVIATVVLMVVVTLEHTEDDRHCMLVKMPLFLLYAFSSLPTLK